MARSWVKELALSWKALVLEIQVSWESRKIRMELRETAGAEWGVRREEPPRMVRGKLKGEKLGETQSG
jgi:hypothetical protein